MCFRTKLNTRIRAIEKTFEAEFSEPERYVPQQEINGFDFLKNPVIPEYSPSEIQFFNWGLIPHWAKTDEIKKFTLNAKIETLQEKASFRDAVKNRCLIVADGFYEWQWLDSKGKNKQKYLIRSVDQPVFAFAGIYSTWKDPANGREVSSFSILTTEANELMATIHNRKKRMPVILQQHDRRLWLEGSDVENFAFPYEVPLIATAI